MYVRARMTPNPISVPPETPVTEAQLLMKKQKIHRLPVVDREGRLKGIVTEKDILYASPSPATSLNVYEMSYLLAKLTVGEVMSTNVLSIHEDMPLEEAARLMAENNISGLPVMRNGQLVGMITESDLFEVFLEMLGGWEDGLRATVRVDDHMGSLAKITTDLAKSGGDIRGVGFFHAEASGHAYLTLKVRGLSKEVLEKSLSPNVEEVIDIR